VSTKSLSRRGRRRNVLSIWRDISLTPLPLQRLSSTQLLLKVRSFQKIERSDWPNEDRPNTLTRCPREGASFTNINPRKAQARSGDQAVLKTQRSERRDAAIPKRSSTNAVDRAEEPLLTIITSVRPARTSTPRREQETTLGYPKHTAHAFT
jgi:hypothetical protein